MSEPPGLSELNIFEGNLAENGPTFATEEVSMVINGRNRQDGSIVARSLANSNTNCKHMSGKFEDDLPFVSVDLVDCYNQFYPVDSNALVEATAVNYNDCGMRAAKVCNYQLK